MKLKNWPRPEAKCLKNGIKELPVIPSEELLISYTVSQFLNKIALTVVVTFWPAEITQQHKIPDMALRLATSQSHNASQLL